MVLDPGKPWRAIAAIAAVAIVILSIAAMASSTVGSLREKDSRLDLKDVELATKIEAIKESLLKAFSTNARAHAEILQELRSQRRQMIDILRDQRGE